MKFGSVCSGIEAASVAWHPLGWRTAWVAEIDPFCCSLLKHHYPEVHNYGDFTTIDDSAEPVDVLVGGTPCQDFSVAGLRAGLDGERGQLTIEFARLAARKRPRWLVWENVPGVLSIDGGRAFGAFLGLLGKLGYGFAYRVLDAQHFGVPQRRRRVFVVGHLGDWRRAAAVLFERHSLSGHPAPSRKTRQDVAPTISARTKGGGGLGTDFDLDGGLIASTGRTSHCLNAGGMGRIDYETETLVTHAVAFSCKDHGADASYIAPTLRSMGHDGSHANAGGQVAVALAIRGRDGVPQIEMGDEVANAILTPNGGRGGIGVGAMMQGVAVRRLLPSECESLQGFPRGYTAVPYRGKPAADGPRYKALGNSMAVPVMQWLGQRIQMVEDIGK